MLEYEEERLQQSSAHTSPVAPLDLSPESAPTPLDNMYSRFAAVSSLAFAVLAAAADSCNTGSMQCCNHVEDVRSLLLPSQVESGLPDTNNQPSAVQLRFRVRATVCARGDRCQRAGRDGPDRSPVLAALRGRRGWQQRMLGVAGVLPEQQRRKCYAYSS